MRAGAALEALLRERVGARGAASLALRSPREAWRGAVGLPASAPEPPRFLAYSITKSFLAVLALQLRDEGRLALDDPLARWFESLPEADAITLRQLLTHTAGLRDYGALPAYVQAVQAGPEAPWSFAEFAAHTLLRGPLSQPGERFAYSNPGYALVKEIVEREAAAPLREAIATRIAEPLGLRATAVVETLGDLADLVPAATRFGRAAGEPLDARRHYHPGWVWHGVVASTAEDVADFFSGLFGGRLVSEATLREMTALVPVASPWPHGEPGYGLGLMGCLRRGVYGHNGGGPGWTASGWCARAEEGPVAVCAMLAFEDPALAEALAFAALALAGARDGA